MNVGAGRKKDCLKKLATIPILLRLVDRISKDCVVGGWNEHETRKALVLYRKWEVRVGCRSLSNQWQSGWLLEHCTDGGTSTS